MNAFICRYFCNYLQTTGNFSFNLNFFALQVYFIFFRAVNNFKRKKCGQNFDFQKINNNKHNHKYDGKSYLLV